MEFANQVVFLAGVLVLISILASVITPRVGVPLLLVFLVIGMLAGEEGFGGIQFDNYRLANLAGIAALAVILFDGGMRTPMSSFRVGLRPAATLATLGVIVTAAITGAFAAWLLDLPLAAGLLIGAIVGSTDAAAVFSLLQNSGVALNQRISSVLEIESGSNDPMAVFLTLALIQYLLAPADFSVAESLLFLAQQMGVGAAAGLIGGVALVYGLNRLDLSDALYPLMALFSGLLIFGCAALLGGSGFLAAYLAGLVLGNRSVRAYASIRRFHDGMAWLAQIGMFLILGLLAAPAQLVHVAVPGLLIAMVLILVARPAAVALCLLPFNMPWRDQVYVGWVGLRGSVPIVLATFPWAAGLDDAQVYFNMAFFIVLMSLVIQGWTVAPAARLLGLDIPLRAVRVQRSDFDLPGQRDYEIVTYRVQPDSALVDLNPEQLPLSQAARVICVARQGRVLPDRDVISLQSGDYVSLLSAKSDLPALDELFHQQRQPLRLREAVRFFGEFIIRDDAPLETLADTYGFELPAELRGLTAGAAVQLMLARPVVGDTLRLGPVSLVVRRVEAELAAEIGLRLPH